MAGAFCVDAGNGALTVKELFNSICLLTQFAIHTDGKGFEIQYVGLEIIKKGGEKKDVKAENLDPVKNIYKNQADPSFFGFLLGAANVAKQQDEEAKKQQDEKIMVQLQKEALDASDKLLDNLLITCDGLYYLSHSNNLYVLKELDVRISKLEKIVPKKLTQADMLNNVKPSTIEWVGAATLVPKLYRIRKYKGWDKWVENNYNSGYYKTFSIKLIKDADGWKFDPSSTQYYQTSVDCKQISDINTQTELETK